MIKMRILPTTVIVLLVSALCSGCGDGPVKPGATSNNRQITGVVAEEGYPDFPIAGAQVRLTTSGLTTSTLNNGTFAIIASTAANDADIEISKTGFATQLVAVPMADASAVRVQLHRTVPPPDYTGTYTMTIGDGTNCATLPEPLRRRSYTATLTQDWPLFEIRLSGATFATDSRVTSNRLRGSIIRDVEMRFFDLLSHDAGGGYDADLIVAEVLPDGSSLVISGHFTNTIATLPSGALTGAFTLFDNLNRENESVRAGCSGTFPYAIRR